MTRQLKLLIACFLIIVVLSPIVIAQDSDTSSSEESNIIIDVVLPLSLAYIMFSLGLGLRVSDFGLILSEPKAFAVGLGNQMIVLPIVGFGIANIFDLSGEMAVGLMILACCPGGVTSNILTKLSGGDTALSISYTAVVSVLSVARTRQETGARMFVNAKGKTRMLNSISSRMRGGNFCVPVPSISVM